MQKRERRSKNFFNKMQDDAAEATKPQPRVVKFWAHIRKHDYQIMATTWREAAEQVQQHSGLEVHRQVLRFNDVDLVRPLICSNLLLLLSFHFSVVVGCISNAAGRLF
jgi:hypothetical protein